MSCPQHTDEMLRRWIYRALTCLAMVGTLAACAPSDPQSSSDVAEDFPAPPPPEAPKTSKKGPLGIQWQSQSERATIKPLQLSILGGALADGLLVLDVQFVNVSETSFVLAGELSGNDFLLREVGGGISTPKTFSDSLQRIDTGDGIGPGERRFGTVTFDAPSSEVFELYFSDFSPISIERQVLAVGGRADLPDPPPSPVDEPEDTGDGDTPSLRIQESILAAQATALERFDVEGYLATFVAGAHHHESKIMHGLRSLPLASVDITPIDPAQAALTDAQLGSGLTLAELVYRLDGHGEDNPFVHQLLIAWEKPWGRWHIAGIADLGDRPLMWRRGELAVHRTNHFLLYTQPSESDALVDLAVDTEAAYASLLSQGLPLDPGYVVYLVADGQEFRAVTGRSDALGVAVARYLRMPDGTTTVDSRGFYINGPIFAQRPDDPWAAELRATTVTHELVHLALSNDTRPHTPIWLSEGMAVYFSNDMSYDASRDLVARSLDDLDLERLTTAAELGNHGAARVGDAYLYSGLAVTYLVENYGRQEIFDLYAAYASTPPGEFVSLASSTAAPADASESSHAALALRTTNRLFEARFGMDLDTFDAKFKAWLRQRFP